MDRWGTGAKRFHRQMGVRSIKLKRSAMVNSFEIAINIYISSIYASNENAHNADK